MSDKSEATVLGSLPHKRPARRSDKRAKAAARPAPKTAASPAPKTASGQAPPRKAAEPSPDRRRGACPSSLPGGTELLGTVAKAAVELAEIGLTVGARALRSAVSRLPRP